MNIYLRELKATYKSFFVWSAAMVFLIFAGMMKYGAFAKTGQSVNEMFAALPPQLLKMFGVEPGMDLNSIGVFYSIFFLYFLLLTSVHSCLLGVNIIAKEERDKTADFLLVKPIRRHQAVTAKILSALSFVVLINLVTCLASMAVVAQYNATGQSLNGPILSLSLALLIIQLVFLSIGLFLGAWSKTAASAAGVATAVILGAFVLNVLIDLNPDLRYLEFLTPFRYFNSLKVMYEQEMRPAFVLLSGGLVAALTAGTYIFFRKRDIYG